MRVLNSALNLELEARLRQQWHGAIPVTVLVDLGQSGGKFDGGNDGEGCDGENGEVTAPALFIDRVG